MDPSLRDLRPEIRLMASQRRRQDLASVSRQRRLSGPLAAAMAPPGDKASEQRNWRLEIELEAKSVSDMIDEELRKEAKIAMPERPCMITLLLMGQSRSGKSTLLKRL